MNLKQEDIILKKELLLNVLKQLSGIWDLADAMYALVNTPYANDKLMNGIISTINDSAKKVKNQEQKIKFEKALGKLERIKNIEKKGTSVEESNLENMLENID